MTVLVGLAAPAHAVETTVTLPTGEHRIEVPAGVTAIEYELYGGRGGGTLPSLGGAFDGALSGITPGDVYWGYVGSDGASALNGSGGGGGGTDIRYTRKASPCDGESAADIIWAAGGGGGHGADGFGGAAGEDGGESVETGAFGGRSGDNGGAGRGGGGDRVANCGGFGGPDGAGAAGGFNGGGAAGSGSSPGGGGGGGYDGGGGGGNGSGGGGGSSNWNGDPIAYSGPPRMVLGWNDTDTPVVSITAPADGATLGTTTPDLAGSATRVLGDDRTVAIRLEQGTTTIHRTAAVDAESGTWQLGGLALARGQWTLTVTQRDSAGHEGVASRTFTIAQDATGPDPDPDPGEAPPLTVSFTPSATTVDRAGPLILDGSATRRSGAAIASFEWDVTGDRVPDVTCGGATPILDTRLHSAGTREVTLTARDTLGRTASVSQAITVSTNSAFGSLRAGRGPQRYPARLFSGSPFITGLCKADTQFSGVDTTVKGPPPGCNAEVTFSRVKAVGCFERVDRGDLPAAEYRILRPYLDDELRTEVSRASGARASQLTGRLTRSQAYTLMLLDAVYVTSQPARINGVDVVPEGDGVVVVVAGGLLESGLSAVISSDARVQMLNAAGEEMRMRAGQIAQDIDPNLGKPLFDRLRLPEEFDLIPGLGIRGRVTTRIENYALKLDIHAVLPPLLGGITAGAQMTADTARGLVLDGLKAHADTVPIGPVIFRDLDLTYVADGEKLDGGLSVSLPPTGTTVRAEIGFLRGAFNRLRIRYDGPPDIILAPAVHLTGIGGALQVDPTEFSGDATLNIGPNPGGGCPKLGVEGAMLLHLESPVFLEVTGSSQLLCYKLVQVRAYLDETGYGSFTGKVEPDLGPLPLRLRAEGTGQIQLPVFGKDLRFQLNADGEGCLVLDPIDECIGGEVVVSDAAMGFCGDFGFTHAGAGFRYPPPATLASLPTLVAWTLGNLVVMFDSCNIAQFRTLPKLARAAQSGETTFTVPPSQRLLALGVRGAGAPPRITLHGPGGRTVDVPDQGMLRTATEAAWRYDHDDTAYLLVDDPAAGTWTITEKDGSAPVADVRLADAVPDPVVRGRVRRAKGQLAFDYSARLSKGMDVRFFERVGGHGGQFLGEGREGRGRVRFLPSEGGSTRRTIVAEVTRDGLPVKTLTAARFRSGPPAIGKARRIRARRRGRRLQITWRRARNATEHRVTVGLSDGRRLLLVPKGRRTRVTVGQVAKGTKARIVVRGERPGPRLGPSAARRLRLR